MTFDSEKLLARAEREAAAGTETAEAALPVITFYWADELYGLPLAQVREVSKVPAITPVPGLPPALVGATNLRGEVMPVCDLRPLVGLDAARVSALSRLVIVAYGSERVGLLVDGIGDIFEIPALASASAADLVRGQTVLPSGQMLTVLDLGRALAALTQ